MLINIHMFTGIIEKRSLILSTKANGTCLRVAFETPDEWNLMPGESISIDGICSTVVAQTKRRFEVEYMPQTLSKTTAALFAPGRLVHFERSLRYGDRVHGHFVAGHVDACGQILRTEQQGHSCLITIALPKRIASYVVERGSVAINGVSLTIAKSSARSFDVALIPYTLKKTNLGLLVPGMAVNIECDMLARYGLAASLEGATVPVNAKKGIRKKAPKRRRVKT